MTWYEKLKAWLRHPFACGKCGSRAHYVGPDNGYQTHLKCQVCGAYHIVEGNDMTPVTPPYQW